MDDTESHMEAMLLLVLDASLLHAGKSRADLARELGVARSTISRRMDGNASAIRAGGLDTFVSAVSRLTGVPSIWLWEHALKAWDEASLLGPGIWSAIEKPQGRDRILQGMVEALRLREGAVEAPPRFSPADEHESAPPDRTTRAGR